MDPDDSYAVGGAFRYKSEYQGMVRDVEKIEIWIQIIIIPIQKVEIFIDVSRVTNLYAACTAIMISNET
jgi:hypothetical protein